MKKELKLEFDYEDIKSFRVGSLIVLEPKTDALKTLFNFDESFDLMDWMDMIAKDNSIKGILFIGNEECFSDNVYAKYISSITGQYIDSQQPKFVTEFVDKRKREIQINMLNNYIRKIIEFPRMVFIALTGCVVSPFFGISLVSDFRIANPNSIIHLNSKEYGLHPSGGVPFFLAKHIGLSKTQEILYSQRFINVNDAKEMGLVNYLTSVDNYRNDALSIAIDVINSTDVKYFFYTKKLVNHRLLNEFDAYVDVEANMALH
jgi:enoyl-CoA hydratase/carnithine racemase